MMYWLLAALAIFQVSHVPLGTDARAIAESNAGSSLRSVVSEWAAEVTDLTAAAADAVADLDSGDLLPVGRSLLVRRLGRKKKRGRKGGKKRRGGRKKKGKKKRGGKKKKSKGKKKKSKGRKKKSKGRSGGGSGGSGGSGGGSGGFSKRGDLTYYGGAGKGGACTQTWKPSGFKTVAINAPQYNGGSMCGTCVEGCYVEKGKKKCFKAIIDNKCPECKSGDLDMGTAGDGRWDLQWKTIKCPTRGSLQMSTQGSNKWYAKVKAEGGPMAIKSMVCNGINGKRTVDAFWEFNNQSKGFCGGLKCTATYGDGSRKSGNVSGGKFC